MQPITTGKFGVLEQTAVPPSFVLQARNGV